MEAPNGMSLEGVLAALTESDLQAESRRVEADRAAREALRRVHGGLTIGQLLARIDGEDAPVQSLEVPRPQEEPSNVKKDPNIKSPFPAPPKSAFHK